MLWRTKTPQQDLSNRARPSYLAGRSQYSLLPLINFEQQLQTQAEVKFVAAKSFPKRMRFYCTTLCEQRSFGQTSHVPKPTSDFSKSDRDPVQTRQTLLIFRKAATRNQKPGKMPYIFHSQNVRFIKALPPKEIYRLIPLLASLWNNIVIVTAFSLFNKPFKLSGLSWSQLIDVLNLAKKNNMIKYIM